jgi:fluoride exporter
VLYPLSYRGKLSGQTGCRASLKPAMIPAQMNMQSITLVFLGAGAGGVSRYLLSLGLNPLFAAMPLGTLAANLVGSALAGALFGLVTLRTGLDPVLRPLLITGFMGGLTTFSSFALEVTQMLEAQRLLLAGGTVLVHVAGSLLFAMLGLWSIRALLG